jgi:hypothetical protein
MPASEGASVLLLAISAAAAGKVGSRVTFRPKDPEKYPDDRRTGENDRGERDGAWRPNQRDVLAVIRELQPQPSRYRVGEGDDEIEAENPY